ncbi:MAG TPA: ATP-binding protein [Chitinophagaceae bacterium]|nr:ATP-binding protein [Chitinophagaceae bacterium]
MRYLNKIVFINSADRSIKYAEVSLDGNVHFIGTQGVGKSTLLRAILFFYNADKTKLGIAREKKNFDEYYFPYQNSYIIYEIMKESGAYCVLAFKSQGRVAFRFFDSPFDKSYFIDEEGRAFESWEKTRNAFGKHIYYTKIIHNYEEYRNILYGNNRGLPAEFRKYAIVESRQFQNIPRTIQNVFLNTKLDAEFIKQTIINSLNEEEIRIDLDTYAHNHLKDFEANLSDIRKWTEKDRNGVNPLEKQAADISKYHEALKHLEKRKIIAARQLGWALNDLFLQQPKVTEKLKQEEEKRDKVQLKADDLESKFDKKKEKIQEEIGKYKSKADEIKTKLAEYTILKIDYIIARVATKQSLELERKTLRGERELLTSKFIAVDQRYEALLARLDNQFAEFLNSKQKEKNEIEKEFLESKGALNKQYESIYEEIRKQHEEELSVAKMLVEEKKEGLNILKVRRSELRHRRFYEKEIATCEAEIQNLQSTIGISQNKIASSAESIKNLQKGWSLEESAIRETHKRDVEKQIDRQSEVYSKIEAINDKIVNSRDSLYGWLTEHKPGWDETIGKVIDEENVLFQPGLSPEVLPGTDLSFYGIQIDLKEISKSVKTVADYEVEKEALGHKISAIKKTISELSVQSEENINKLKKRFQPKIRELKEIIQTSEYAQEQAKMKLDEACVRSADLKTRAEAEQNQALDEIDDAIAGKAEEEINAAAEAKRLEGNVNKQVETKRKEKESKLKAKRQEVSDMLDQIDTTIQERQTIVLKGKSDLRAKQKKELKDQGADTKRIEAIDVRISTIDSELIFIENNRDLVAEYNKDKRELFDKADEFKSRRMLSEKQLATEQLKYQQQKERLSSEIETLNASVNATSQVLQEFKSDLTAFEGFKKTEAYSAIEETIVQFSDDDKTDKNCRQLTDELTQAHYTSIERYTSLQEAINKFTGNFQENNIFSFKIKFYDRAEFLEFALSVKEFIDEDKIGEYKKRVEERFAHIVSQIGKETGNLISKEGEIHGVISDINKDFMARNFVGAIKRMELRTVESANRIVQLLILIKKFNDENAIELGAPNLFTTADQPQKNEKAITLLKQLIKEMANYKEKEITLSDSFELQFRIVENDNDTDWVEKLSNVGSDGTDVLVKAMINIMLLNVFKERASKKQKSDFRLHCMMDEIGKLHPTNIKGILKFANDRNILLINSSPTTYNATDYRYTYLLSKDNKNVMTVKRLISKTSKPENPNKA